MLHDGIDELVRLRIHTKIMHDESGAAQHHDAEVFPDIVQVALHSAHDYRAQRLHAGR